MIFLETESTQNNCNVSYVNQKINMGIQASPKVLSVHFPIGWFFWCVVNEAFTLHFVNPTYGGVLIEALSKIP
jgi:hypothetical protein